MAKFFYVRNLWMFSVWEIDRFDLDCRVAFEIA
jgi:hypothetical protein